MLAKRIIPCLDVRDGKVTKGMKFLANVDVGDPVAMAKYYYEQGADEIVFYDITASNERRGIMLEVVSAVAKDIFIPFSVGGGLAHARRHARGAAGGRRESFDRFGRGAQSRNHHARVEGVRRAMHRAFDADEAHRQARRNSQRV